MSAMHRPILLLVLSLWAIPLSADEPLPFGAVARVDSARFRHPAPVSALVLLPDGKTLVTAGQDHLLRVWDLNSAKFLRTLEGHTEEPRGLVISPDGKLLVSAGYDRRLIFWDAADWKITDNMQTHEDCIEGLALCPDGRIVVTACRDFRLGITDLKKDQTWLEGHKSSVRCVQFTPDGSQFASAGWDKTIRIWDVAKRQTVQTIKDLPAAVETIAFTPDGKLLAVGFTEGGEVSLWNVADAKLVRRWTTPHRRVAALHFSLDGKTIFTGGDGWALGPQRRATLAAFDVATGKVIWTRFAHDPGNFFEGKTAFRTTCDGTSCLTLTRDGKRIITAGADGRVRLWNASTGAEIDASTSQDDDITSLVFTDNGRTLVTSCLDGALRWWDVKGRKLTRKIEVGRGELLQLTRSGDGKLLAIAGAKGNVSIWDADEGTRIRTLESPFPTLLATIRIAFTPDGLTLAAAYPTPRNATEIVLWDVGTGKELRRLHNFHDKPLDLAFSPDGAMLAGIAEDEPVRMWDVKAGKILPAFPDRLRGATCLAWSPDGKVLAAGFDGSRSIVLWDIATGKKLQEFADDGSRILALAWAEDSQSLITIHEDRAARLWEVSTGKERRTYAGHDGQPTALALCGDGRRFATASRDRSILLWDRFASADAAQKTYPLDKLQGLWIDLAGDDAKRAYDAVCALACKPDQSLPFLAPRLGALPKVEAKQIDKWIADLDVRSFKAREEAMDNLARLGRLVEPQLQAKLDDKPTLEMRRRVELLLKRMGGAGPVEEWKRLERAVEALERIGGPRAIELLEKLAQGGDFRPTQSARAALARLKTQGKP